MSPIKKQEVKEKQLEALKRLGHTDLELDEYESNYPPVSLLSHTLTTNNHTSRSRRK